MKVKRESEVTQSCLTPHDPMDEAYQAPPSMGFSRQGYWSGLSLPSPGALPDIEKLLASVSCFIPWVKSFGLLTNERENAHYVTDSTLSRILS